MISIVFVSNINFPLIFPSKTAKTNLPIQVSVSEFCERGVVAVLSGRSRFSQAQKGSGSRTVYRRHRREEILIRPTVLDNAYRNSSSRVESFQRSQPRRCFLSPSLFFPFALSPSALPSFFHLRLCSSFPLLPPADPAFVPLIVVLFPSAVFIGQRRHGARLHYTHIHSTVALLEKSGIEPPRPRTNRSPSSSLSLRRFHDISARPCSAGISLSFSLFLLLPSRPLSRTAFFSTFFEPFCYEAASSLSFPLSRKGPGTRLGQGAGAVLDFQCPSTNGSEGWNGSRWTLDEHRAEISTPSWEMEFIAATEYTLHTFLSFLFFFFFLFLSFQQIPLSFSIFRRSIFLSSSFVFVCDVTDRNRRGTRHDGKGLAASRACDRSIRIR